jgi:alkylation response protein AidB-like acyl-CoA dehydrogenase
LVIISYSPVVGPCHLSANGGLCENAPFFTSTCKGNRNTALLRQPGRPMLVEKILSPDDPAIEALCARLVELGPAMDRTGAWPAEQLTLCRDAGVFEWFVGEAFGGQGWDEADIVRGELRLSEACLTTAFVLTQWSGAARRIAACENVALREQLLPEIVAGRTFCTLGISHLTTSRRHLAAPVMQVDESAGGFLYNGFSPWVTGGRHARTVVTGGELADGRRILVALPTHLGGVRAGEPALLIGVDASDTGPIECKQTLVDRKYLMAGPSEDVMAAVRGANTGGLQTTTLALGLSTAAVKFLFDEAERRSDLAAPAAALRDELEPLREDLLAAASGVERCSPQDLRTRANSLVLRSTQAALAAAKGSGYVVGHPAGRWCREALFFLVWSCPPAVMNANLCQLAGIAD